MTMIYHRYDAMIDRAQVYQERLKQLNWSEYRLAQEVAKLRTERNAPATAQQIYSSIRKCIADPGNCKQSINDDIVAALEGETLIRWTTYQEVKL